MWQLQQPRKTCPTRNVIACFNGSIEECCSYFVGFNGHLFRNFIQYSCQNEYSHFVNDVSVNALVKTGSTTLRHVSDKLIPKLDVQLQKVPYNCFVGLAVKGNFSSSLRSRKCNIEMNGSTYNDVSFTMLKDLWSLMLLLVKIS